VIDVLVLLFLFITETEQFLASNFTKSFLNSHPEKQQGLGTNFLGVKQSNQNFNESFSKKLLYNNNFNLQSAN
jgi:hypothetical protein